MLLPWLRRLVRRPAAHTALRPKARGKAYRPWLEPLETRVVPAFDLTLSANPTVGVGVTPIGTTTTFTATATGANLDWSDVATALATGSVVIDSGSAGTEAGNITDQFVGVNTLANKDGTSLTVQSGSGTNLVGDISLGTINLTGANSTVVVTAQHDASAAALEQALGQLQAVTITAGGTVTGGPIRAVNLAVRAGTGIGSALTPLQTQASNLVAQTTTSGDVDVSNTGDLTIGFTGEPFAGVSSTGGSVSLALDTGSTLTVNDDITASAQTISLSADRMDFNAAVNAGTGTVVLTAPTNAINLVAGAKPAGVLALTQNDLNEVKAGTELELQSLGDITIAAAITAPTGWNTLWLNSGGQIQDTTAGSAPSLAVDNLLLSATNGIGGSTAAGLKTQVQDLQFQNGAGAVTMTNTGGLILPSTLNNVSLPGGHSFNTGTTTTLSAGSPIVFAADTTSAGTLTATATSAAATTDGTITVNAGVTVESTGGDVDLTADADVSLKAGSVVKSDAGAVDLTAGNDPSDLTATLSAAGTISAATTLTLNAPADVTLGSLGAGTTLTVTSTKGSIRDDGDDTTFVKAPSINLTAAKAIGGDTAITPADVLTQDANFTQAIDFAGALALVQNGAGGNVQLRDVDGTFNSASFGGAFPAPVGTGSQLALIASGGALAGTTAGDLDVDQNLTLSAGANTNLLLAATDGNSVKIDAVVTNNATSSPTALAVGGTGAISNPGTTIGTADVLAQSIDLVTGGGAIGTAALPLQISGVAGGAVALNGDSAGGNVFVTDDGTGGVVVGLLDAHAGNVTLNDTSATITSAKPNDGTADVVGNTVTLSASGQIGSFSAGSAKFFEVQATTLNASTNSSRLWISAIGGTAVGSVSAGTEMAFLNTVNGDLTSTHSGATPDVAAGTVVLTADNGSIGSAAKPLLVDTLSLQASVTNTGSINVTKVTVGDLAVSQATTADGAINLATKGGALNITGTISAGSGGAINLTSGGAINETGAGLVSTTDTLTTSSSGGTQLNGASNAVGKFNATNTTGGDVSLTNSPSPAALLTVTGIIQSGGGSVTVSNAGALTTSGAVTTAADGSISLTATGGTETLGAVVTAGGAGTVTLAATGNSSDVLVNATVSSASGAVGATAGRSVTLNAGNVTTGGNVSLTATKGAVNEAGAGTIGGALLKTVSATGTALNNNNAVSSFNATDSSGAGISLVNTAAPLTVTGISESGTGNVTVSNAGTLSITGAVSAGSGGTVALSATGASSDVLVNATVSSTSGAVGATAGRSVTLNAGSITTTGNVNLTATAGAVSEAGAGTIGGALLTTTSATGTALGNSNTVSSFNASDGSGAGISLMNTAAPLTITGISETGTGNVGVTNKGAVKVIGAITTAGNGGGAGGNIALATTANGSETIGAAITAGGAGTITLTTPSGGNDILINAAVGDGSGGIGATAGGAITEGGVGAGVFSTTGTLSTNSAAGTTLNNANSVSAFHAGDGSGAGISLANAIDLAVTGISESGSGNVTINETGQLTVQGTGISAAGGSVTLSETTGLLLNADVSAAGGFAQTGAGAVTVGGAGTRNVTTAGNTVSFASGLTLTTGLSVDATTGGNAAGANVTFGGAISGAQALTVNAGGGGDLAFQGALGSPTRLGALTITNAKDVNTQAITAASITQSAGQGTTTFGGNLDANAGGIDLTGTNFTDANGVQSDTRFRVNDTGTATFSGNVSGTAFVQKDGTGALALSGNNTYTGVSSGTTGTVVNAGTLQVGSDTALSANDLSLADKTTLSAIIGDRTLANNIGLGGQATISDQVVASVPTNLTLNGQITGDNGGLTLNMKASTGVLTLTNTDTYKNSTILIEGILAANGSLTRSGVSLAGASVAATTLAGIGSVNGITAGSGGTVAPGPLVRTVLTSITTRGSGGVLTSTAPVTLNGNAALTVHLNGTADRSLAPVRPTAGVDYDQLKVTSGAFTAGGAILNPTLGTASAVNDVFVIVNTASGTGATAFKNLPSNTNLYFRNQLFPLVYQVNSVAAAPPTTSATGTEVVLWHKNTAPVYTSVTVSRDVSLSKIAIIGTHPTNDTNLNTIAGKVNSYLASVNTKPGQAHTLVQSDFADQAWVAADPDELDTVTEAVSFGDGATLFPALTAPDFNGNAAKSDFQSAPTLTQDLSGVGYTFPTQKHQYAAQIIANVSAATKDTHVTTSNLYKETVLDAPLYNGNPIAVVTTLPVTVFKVTGMQLATFAALAATAGVPKPASSLIVTVNWGDHSRPDTTPSANVTVTLGTDKNGRPIYIVRGTHNYVGAGKWVVTVSVTDKANPAVSLAQQPAASKLLGPSALNSRLLVPMSTVIFTGPQNSDEVVGRINNATFGGGLPASTLNLFTHLGLNSGQFDASALALFVEQSLFSQSALAATVNKLAAQFHISLDSTTMNAYVQFLAHNGTRQQLELRILTSPAYQAYVASSGQSWASDAVRDYFLYSPQKASPGGGSLGAMAASIVQGSAGYVEQIYDLYNQFLNRNPNAGELSRWVGLLQRTNENALERQFLSDASVVNELKSRKVNSGEFQTVPFGPFPA